MTNVKSTYIKTKKASARLIRMMVDTLPLTPWVYVRLSGTLNRVIKSLEFFSKLEFGTEIIEFAVLTYPLFEKVGLALQ